MPPPNAISAVQQGTLSVPAQSWAKVPLPHTPSYYFALINGSDQDLRVRYQTAAAGAPSTSTGTPLMSSGGSLVWNGLVPSCDVYVYNPHASAAKDVSWEAI